jgi:hypothetical protein
MEPNADRLSKTNREVLKHDKASYIGRSECLASRSPLVKCSPSWTFFAGDESGCCTVVDLEQDEYVVIL